MGEYGHRREIDLCSSRNRGGSSDWEGIIDRIEEAIVLSLANRVLEKAGIREEKVREDRKKVRVVKLRGFPHKRQAN